MGLSLSRIYGSLSSLAFWGKDKEVRILMVGLDSAGKTTILYRLQVGPRGLLRGTIAASWCGFPRLVLICRSERSSQPYPVSLPQMCPPHRAGGHRSRATHSVPSLTDAAAIGFNVETVSYKNINFQVWDLGGQSSIRPYWRCYYANTQVSLRLPCVRGQRHVVRSRGPSPNYSSSPSMHVAEWYPVPPSLCLPSLCLLLSAATPSRTLLAPPCH